MTSRKDHTNLVSNFVLIFYSIITLIPVAYMISTSLKDSVDSATNPGFVPRAFAPQNYLVVWKEVPDTYGIPPLWEYFKNSIIIVAISVAAILVVSTLAGYAFSRFRFPGRQLLFYMVLGGLMLPPIAITIPIFVLDKTYGLLNTYWAVIGPYIALNLPFAILILTNYFDTLPMEIEDAARVDGCSDFRAFRSVALPLLRPALATVAIFSFLNIWNEFLLALIFLQQKEIQTVSLAILVYRASFTVIDFGKMFAVLTLVTIPVMVFYMFLQRQFIRGLTAGAVKG